MQRDCMKLCTVYAACQELKRNENIHLLTHGELKLCLNKFVIEYKFLKIAFDAWAYIINILWCES